MSICLLSEVKQQWATLVLGWVTVPPAVGCTRVSDGFALMLGDQNTFWSCSQKEHCPSDQILDKLFEGKEIYKLTPTESMKLKGRLKMRRN